MSKIILPPRPNRIWLMNFWLVISLFGGLLIGIFSRLLLYPWWFGLGAILILLLALPGLLRLKAIIILYRAWNKLARYVSRLASTLLMGISFYIIFVAVRRTGIRLMVDSPSLLKSLWFPRKTLAPNAYNAQYDFITNGSSKNGWISTFFSWTLRSGNLWACCLLPFLILLSFFETDQKDSVSANIYTLY